MVRVIDWGQLIAMTWQVSIPLFRTFNNRQRFYRKRRGKIERNWEFCPWGSLVLQVRKLRVCVILHRLTLSYPLQAIFCAAQQNQFIGANRCFHFWSCSIRNAVNLLLAGAFYKGDQWMPSFIEYANFDHLTFSFTKFHRSFRSITGADNR